MSCLLIASTLAAEAEVYPNISLSPPHRSLTHRIKPIPQPLLHQPSRKLQPNDPLPQTQHLRIIAQHRPLNTEAIMRRHGSDPSDLVRGNRDAQPGAADQQRAVGFP